MKITIHPLLDWLMPYVLMSHETPNIDKLRRITAVRPKSYQEQHAVAALHKVGAIYKITIHTHTWIDRGTKEPKLVPYSRVELVEAFAHELAHLSMTMYRGDFWCLHTPEHLLATAQHLERFALLLKHLGYESAESELESQEERGYCPST